MVHHGAMGHSSKGWIVSGKQFKLIIIQMLLGIYTLFSDWVLLDIWHMNLTPSAQFMDIFGKVVYRNNIFRGMQYCMKVSRDYIASMHFNLFFYTDCIPQKYVAILFIL